MMEKKTCVMNKTFLCIIIIIYYALESYKNNGRE